MVNFIMKTLYFEDNIFYRAASRKYLLNISDNLSVCFHAGLPPDSLTFQSNDKIYYLIDKLPFHFAEQH